MDALQTWKQFIDHSRLPTDPVISLTLESILAFMPEFAAF